MMILLSHEEAEKLRQEQQQTYQQALAETLLLFPGTDPLALTTFGEKISYHCGLINEADMQLARQYVANLNRAQ